MIIRHSSIQGILCGNQELEIYNRNDGTVYKHVDDVPNTLP